MSYKSNYEELVSRFLDGEMSKSEISDFENQLSNNPEMQEEMQLQKDVIQGIEDVRRLELKARLDGLQVPASNAIQYVGLKVAALVSITIMLGFGAYYYFDDPVEESVDPMEIAEIKKPVEEPVIISEKPVESVEKEEPVVEEEVKTKKEKKKNKRKESSKKENEVVEEKTLAKEANTIPNPEIVKPDIALEFDNSESIDGESDGFEIDNTMDAINKAESGKVEVEMVSDKKKNFHYQFYNKKLYLHGDFSDMPYEIIEFNAEKDKFYYLYYKDQYYGLKTNQSKVTPLNAISDSELIRELELIRSK